VLVVDPWVVSHNELLRIKFVELLRVPPQFIESDVMIKFVDVAAPSTMYGCNANNPAKNRIVEFRRELFFFMNI